MVKLIGNDVWRSGEKIGWVSENHVYAHDGRKLGYFEENHVYGEDGHKLAYIEGDHLMSADGGSKIPLLTVNEAVIGGILSEIGRCAVYVVLGN